MTSQSPEQNWEIEDFSLQLPGFAFDPMPFYRRLQRERPVLKCRVPKLWVVTRYADCVFTATDRRFAITAQPSAEEKAAGTFIPAELHRSELHLLAMDPPDHTRVRRLVSKAFTPKSVEQLRARIEEIANELLDGHLEAKTMDFVSDFAFHLPAIVLAQLLGVPTSDREEFKKYTHAFIQSLGSDVSEERVERGIEARAHLCLYFDDLLERRRASPADDLISTLLAAEDGGTLSADELVGTCILFLAAGHETTTILLSGGLLYLMENPEQLALLRSRRELMASAIEEMLRFSSPVQRINRQAREDIELGDFKILAGDSVVAVLAIANRDPEVFANPDRFDITRDPNPHLGFARGIHHCLGAPLARLEGELAFSILLDRLPNLRLSGRPVWDQSTFVRGLHSLPITF